MRISTLIFFVLLLVTASCGSDTPAATTPAATSATEATAVPPTAVPTTVAAEATATPDPVAEPTVAPEPEPTAEVEAGSETAESDLDVLVTRLVAAYPAVADWWPGFVPADHPVILVQRSSDGEITGAITVNHPRASELGDAALIADHPATGEIHRISNLKPSIEEQVADVQSFEFNRVIDDVDSFLMVAGGEDPFFAIAGEQYVATLLHEMFHRYQFGAFVENAFVEQDVEGYDYSEQNLELAVLEEEALKRAILAEPGSDAQREAATWFAAIRQSRLDRDDRVRLDGHQERYEGTARWIEHAIDIETSRPTAESYAANVFGRSISPDDGVKEHFGFGRWYASGAAVVELARSLGHDDIANRIEQGAEPAELVADAVGFDAANSEALVEAARTTLDPDGAIAALAQELADTAPNEPPVFGDEGGADHEDGTDYSDATAEVDELLEGDFEGGEIMTDEEFQCLVDGGLDMTSDEADIDPALVAACLE